jgi:hypothetical protein
VCSAQFLQDRAEKTLRSAKGQVSCEMFLEGIFSAAVDLRAAQVLYDAVYSSANDPRRQLDNDLLQLVEEAAADAVICEENLAHTGASLRRAITIRESDRISMMDLTDPWKFEFWLHILAELDLREADAELMEAYISLNIPKFLLDFGRCVHRTRQSIELPYAKATLERIIPRLETVLPIGGIFNDTNFLQPAYRCLADVCRQLNLSEEADRYTHLASEEVFEQRLRTIQETVKGDNGLDNILADFMRRGEEFRYD